MCGEAWCGSACSLIIRVLSPCFGENDGALNLVMGKMCSPAPGRFFHICVVGDFNFLRIWWSATHDTPVESKEAKFIYIIGECCLYQHTNGPTRCRGDDMPSQLDLIFLTNELEMVSDVQHMATTKC